MTVSKIYLITNVISLSLFIVEQKCLLGNYVARNHTLYLNCLYCCNKLLCIYYTHVSSLLSF